MKREPKTAMTFRLSDEAGRLVRAIAAEYGIAQAAVIEVAIREKAKRDKIKAPPPASDEQSDAA